MIYIKYSTFTEKLMHNNLKPKIIQIQFYSRTAICVQTINKDELHFIFSQKSTFFLHINTCINFDSVTVY